MTRPKALLLGEIDQYVNLLPSIQIQLGSSLFSGNIHSFQRRV